MKEERDPVFIISIKVFIEQKLQEYNIVIADMGQTIFVQQLYNKGEGPYTTFKLRLQSIEEICSFFTVKLDNSTNLK